jgi:DNA-binding transcriptional LysR family regulator
MDYQPYAWFTEVVRAGSFSAAARKLSVGKSTLSENVSALERSLGADLLIRTTRKLSLTEAGSRLFESCSKGLAEIDAAREEVVARQSAPRGMLRVTAPADLASSALARAFARALAPWPELRLELDFSDRFVDLVGERFDLAIRAGLLQDSTLIARRIGTSSFVLLASPSYLEKEGRPSDPGELARHRCLSFTPLEDEWILASERSRRRIRVSPYVKASSMIAVQQFALEGAGIALLPLHLCHERFRDGSLARVLPAWAAESGPLHLVYPKQSFVQPKIRVVLPVLEKELRALLEGARKRKPSERSEP